jgi:hypothetical protein
MSDARTGKHARRHICGTPDIHRRRAAESPEYRRHARQLEYETRRFVAAHQGQGMRSEVVRIPTVVHIIWNTPDQNPSDAYVQAAIAALNADFRLANPGIANLPPPFAAVAADTRIEFVLAARDPQCNSTTGIERKQYPLPDFAYGNELFKSSGLGLAPWDPHRYLNIWVVNLRESDGRVGYTHKPADLLTDPWGDGIVVATWAFGQNPGHTDHPTGVCLTHECGHWLNLIHIWGDQPNCLGNDQVSDTPPQSGPTYTPIGFVTSCNNAAIGGTMYQNFMDYTDEVYRCMFTRGQAARMQACLSTIRTGLLASDGHIPPDAPTTPDLWMQDCADDTGAEPYGGSGSICGSDDIWIRNGSDGLTYQDHQNPLVGQINTVYVRVRNRGCPGAGAQNGILHLYWAKASPSLSWPMPWDGSVTSPALMGQEIGTGVPVSVTGGAQQIVSFPWQPPDPALYAAFGADQAHFCLLARIETSPAPPFGMTVPETGSLDANVRRNNNIIWKNMAVVYDFDIEMVTDIVVGIFDKRRRVARYTFETAKGATLSLFDWGFLIVEARGDALAALRKADVDGAGFQRLEDGRLLITRPGAWIAAPALKPGQFGVLRLRVVPDRRNRLARGARVFDLQLNERDARGAFLGGQHILVKTGTRPGPDWDPIDDSFDGVDRLLRDDCCGWG